MDFLLYLSCGWDDDGSSARRLPPRFAGSFARLPISIDTRDIRQYPRRDAESRGSTRALLASGERCQQVRTAEAVR